MLIIAMFYMRMNSFQENSRIHESKGRMKEVQLNSAFGSLKFKSLISNQLLYSSWNSWQDDNKEKSEKTQIKSSLEFKTIFTKKILQETSLEKLFWLNPI